MVCDSTYILDQKTRFDTKVEETVSILGSILSSGMEKVVIFSGWDRMTRLVAAELDASGIGYSSLNGRIHRMGQKRNIQVINLVAIGTIEEQMLTKLKFKTDLFDGVLNGGEDEVFLQNSKLETLVRYLGFVQEEDGKAVPAADSSADVGENDLERKSPAQPESPAGAVVAEEELASPKASASVSKSEELVSQGVTFLGNLVQTLKDPAATHR